MYKTAYIVVDESGWAASFQAWIDKNPDAKNITFNGSSAEIFILYMV